MTTKVCRSINIMEDIAWLVLRISYAIVFLFPLKDLLKNFSASVALVKVIIPFQSQFFAVVMIVVMVLGALSVLLGIYAQIAGFFLLIYCLFGMVVHYRLAKHIATIQLNTAASQKDIAAFNEAATLGIVGHQTSGLKNIVLAAVACFFMLVGSGPLSVTRYLF